MDVFIFSVNSVFPLILIVASGFLLKKIKLFDDSFIKNANSLCFKFALPIQLFQNIRSAPFSKTFSLKLVIFSCGGITAVCLLLCLIVPLFIKDKGTSGSFIQGVFRSNFLLLGLPLAISIFGENNVSCLSMLMPFIIITFNFLAVIVLTIFSNDREDRKIDFGGILLSIVKNPLIIASILGIIFSVFKVPLPVFADNAANTIGKMATPLALIILGGQFDLGKLKGNLKLCLIASVLRLFVVPLFFIGGGILLGYRDEELGSIMIMSCAPTAVSSYIMAKSMNNNHVLAGQLVVLTTLLSSVTIFLWVFALRKFMLI